MATDAALTKKTAILEIRPLGFPWQTSDPFLSHPHRGFETVTIVRRGFIVHSEMFPLLEHATPGGSRSMPTGPSSAWRGYRSASAKGASRPRASAPRSPPSSTAAISFSSVDARKPSIAT